MIGRLVNAAASQRTGLFRPLLRNAFCINRAYLNPERHINTGHNPNDCYEDIVMLGDYPVASVTHHKVISQVYVPQIAAITLSHISKKHPSVGAAYEKVSDKTWGELGVNFEEEQMSVLEDLSEQIFVKDSKIRWIKEQQVRLAHTTNVLSGLSLNNTKVAFFVDTYNFLLQELAARSNLYQAKEILGEFSMKEKYAEASLIEENGVPALDNPPQQAKGLINSLLRLVHNH